MQKRRKYITNALELRLFCIKSSIFYTAQPSDTICSFWEHGSVPTIVGTALGYGHHDMEKWLQPRRGNAYVMGHEIHFQKCLYHVMEWLYNTRWVYTPIYVGGLCNDVISNKVHLKSIRFYGANFACANKSLAHYQNILPEWEFEHTPSCNEYT